MRIQPINNISYHNTNNNNVVNKTSFPSRGNVNFGSLETYLLVLVAREGISTLSKTEQRKFLKVLSSSIYGSDNENFVKGVNALTKTPNSLYNDNWSKLGVLASLYGDNVSYIKDLRWKSLKKINSISDSSYINVQIKKDFLNSLFENGHPISPTFVEQFERLDDRIYGSFKQNIIDIALYSSRYNGQRSDPEAWFNKYKGYGPDYDITKCPEEYDWTWHNLNCRVESLEDSQHGVIGSAYQTLKLIASLDKNLYGGWIKQRQASINQLKNIVEQAIFYAKNSYRGYWESSESQNFYNDFVRNLKTI